MAIVSTWSYVPIVRSSGNSATWTVNGTPTDMQVWFGTAAERLTIDPGQYGLIIVDANNDGLVGAVEMRAALNSSSAMPGLNLSAGFLGTSDVDLDGDPATPPQPTVAYSTTNQGIQQARAAVLVSMDPVTAPTFAADYDPGVGNFDPFAPETTDPVCFVGGTLIETVEGPRPVESLVPGDLVLSADHGPLPLRLSLFSTITARHLQRRPELHPIRISAGALGSGLPRRDLLVSPQHRILVRSRIAQRMFGTDEVLVAAKQLLQIDGIDIAHDLDDFRYYHLVFDRHEIVISNGVQSESLYPGPEALRSIGKAARDEIYALFPHLRDIDPGAVIAARILASGRQARKLAHRHLQNHKPLLG